MADVVLRFRGDARDANAASDSVARGLRSLGQEADKVRRELATALDVETRGGVAEVGRLDSSLSEIVRNGDVWVATFEGDCGRPYKYSITMEGRAAGKTVLFKGSADLGPQDGGVYDWIGRATDKEFVGFYTNAYYTGVFVLARPK